LDERDCFGHRAEAVGIRTVVAVARKPALPVGREQPQRIPALRFPRVGDLTPLEDHVVDRAGGEAVAHRQAGVTRADDDGRRSHGRAAWWLEDYLTSTVTFVGLVMMSYTAERFCDCASIARISAGVASASMS